jgi:hypothetical protein
MDIQILHDKNAIWQFLKTSPELQIYCIGDLDDFFWPKTIWYALTVNKKIHAIALLYVGMQIPTLLCFYENNPDYSLKLLEQIKSMLPPKFNAHLSPGLIEIFGKQNVIAYYGLNLKMAITKHPGKIIDSNIKRLKVNDLPMINDFYSVAYPQNWFDKRMLETEKYFGYFVDNKLVGVSGIHV